MGTKQANFRLSAEADKLLKDVAAKRGINKTDVVEYCVARYAAELGVDIDGAKALLLQNLAKSIAAPIRRFFFGRRICKLNYIEAVRACWKYVEDTFQDSPGTPGLSSMPYASWWPAAYRQGL